MALIIPADVFREMLAASHAVAPLEACGLLAGAGERVLRCYVLTNADASAEHYSMKPAEQFAAFKNARLSGLTMLAIWHSHPATPARMSAEDLRLAYAQDVLYVIVSLSEPGRPVTHAFEVLDGHSKQVPVVVESNEESNLT